MSQLRHARAGPESFARDGSVLCVDARGRWACLTITRDDGARALDILLDAEEAALLAGWLDTHAQHARTGAREPRGGGR